MLITTTRFGEIEVDEHRLMEFADGLLGFPRSRQYALIQTSPDPVFFWLQSVQEPSLAFLVCDPREFLPDYEVPVKNDDARVLGLHEQGEHPYQMLVIVNKVDGYLTANLLGPLVIGLASLRGRQLVLSDRRYTTRHRLMRVGLAALPAVRTA